MTWHYTAAPDQVQPELGPDLLDGDYATANPAWAHAAGVWSLAGGGRFVFTVEDPYTYLPLTPDAVYTITAEVRGADVSSWEMALQNSAGEQVTLPVGDVDTIPADDWVTVRADWRAPIDPLTGSPALTATGPGLVEVRNPVMAAQTGRVILTVPGDVLAENIMASGGLVAGDPAGAHLELKGTGLHAYDATGTETAHIRGAEGAFVGAEFRTSDTLPGQVTLADDAYVSSYDGVARPGISVEPEDATSYSILPGVGPESVGMTIDGGKLTTGEFSYITMFPNAATIRSHRSDGTIGGEVAARPAGSLMRTYREDGTTGGAIQTTPTASLMRTYREDGTTGGVIQTSPTSSTMRTYSGNSSEQGWVRVQPQDAELAYVAPDNTYFSRIRATETEAHLFTRAGGANRYLTVDADGIWVKSGSRAYNLEGTTWDTLSLGNGWQAYTGGGGYYQGLRAQRTPLGIRLDGMIQGGGTGQIAPLPATMQDVAAKQFPVAMQGGEIGIMAIHQRSSDGWWVLSYTAGPSTPGWISVSVDAALA